MLFGNAAFRTALKNNGADHRHLDLHPDAAGHLAGDHAGATAFAGVVLFRLIFFLPYVLAEVAAGLIWRFVYDGDYGLFAAICPFLRRGTPYVLADKDLAIYAVLASSSGNISAST